MFVYIYILVSIHNLFYKFITRLKPKGAYVKLEINKLYRFKEEFCVELGIPKNQVERRLDELLSWLSNFYDFEFKKGRPHCIVIKEIIGEYQPLPRKAPKQDEFTKEKKKKYAEFTKFSLTPDYTPNSKSKVAREAIDQFGKQEYGHTSIRAVTERYIKEPFNRYGETNDVQVWVYYSTYKPLEPEVCEKWRSILREEHIGEEEASNAFYRQAEGQDISKELGYFKKARDRFMEKYDDIPILVKEWRLKKDVD